MPTDGNDPHPQPEPYSAQLRAALRELRSQEKEWDEVIATIEAYQARLDIDADAKDWDRLEVERRKALHRRQDVRREQLAKCERAARLTGLTPEEVFQVILREDLKAEQTTLAATNAAVEVPAPPDSNEQTAPVPAVQGQSNHECFTHYPDYREIRFQGQVYFPTSNQALIVKTLHEALKSGSPNVSADALLTQIGSSSSRLPDQFRGRNQSLWGTLIVKIPGSQDRYRLNIPPVSDPEKNL